MNRRCRVIALLLILSVLVLGARGDDKPILDRLAPGDVRELSDFARLDPTGEPPTSSAVSIGRVIDPTTGRPYDSTNRALGCDLKDLRHRFRLESADVLVGEPVLIEFRMGLDGPGEWDIPVFAPRGIVRTEEFLFLLRHPDGTWAADPLAGNLGMCLGGVGGGWETMTRDKPRSTWLAVPEWCRIDRPGAYELYALHTGGGSATVGLDRRIEAALTVAERERIVVDRRGILIDRANGQPWWGPHARPEVAWTTPIEPHALSPIAALLADFVRAKVPEGGAFVNDYARFTLNVRIGNAEERAEMVRRWTAPINPDRDGDASDTARSRVEAIQTALSLGSGDDFLPFLSDVARRPEPDFAFLFLGLALRDDPRIIDILLDAPSPHAIPGFESLRPALVATAIPGVIDLLCSRRDEARSTATDLLNLWTGERLGVDWVGYLQGRPTLAEGRTMQSLYRTWWDANRATFRPKAVREP